jgi:DNA-binding GntR family transcriptional regulator
VSYRNATESGDADKAATTIREHMAGAAATLIAGTA